MILDKSFNFLKPYDANDLIRLGRKEDGGYLVPESIIKKSSHLISFGMASDWSFEEDFLKLDKNNKVEIYDHTVNFSFFLKRLYKSLKRLFYLKSSFKDIIQKTKEFNKYLQIDKSKFLHIKKKVDIENNYRTILVEDIFSNLRTKDVALKIDIENYEYKILKNILKFTSLIELIVIEFHELDRKRSEFLSIISKLQKEYYIVHIHGNNITSYCKDGLPKTVEITFIKKKNKNLNLKKISSYPIKNLDFPNHPYIKDISINFMN